jgi:hypothetical protein
MAHRRDRVGFLTCLRGQEEHMKKRKLNLKRDVIRTLSDDAVHGANHSGNKTFAECTYTAVVTCHGCEGPKYTEGYEKECQINRSEWGCSSNC